MRSSLSRVAALIAVGLLVVACGSSTTPPPVTTPPPITTPPPVTGPAPTSAPQVATAPTVGPTPAGPSLAQSSPLAAIPTATGGFSIGGHVTDEAGVGAEGIVATACGHPCTSSTTAGDGSYVIQDLAPGDYSIDFFDPTGRLASGFAAAQGTFTVTSEDALYVRTATANVTGVDVRLPVGLELSGIVYTPDGAPAASVGVYACPGIQSRGCHGGWSGADGQYRVRGLVDRAYWVATNSDGRYGQGYYSPSGYTNVLDEAAIVRPGTRFDLRLVAGYRIAGIVTDAAGRPIAGLQVGVCFTCRGAVTDGTGGYEVKGLIPGEYVVTFRDPVAGQMVGPSISVTIIGADVLGINARITEPPSATPSPMPTATPAPSPTFPRSPILASLPVGGTAREIGERVQLAPGPGGTLFVSIPAPGGSVLALLDRTGAPSPGWPIVVQHATACDLLLPVEDGTVRIICNETDLPQPDNDPADVRAFAFDSGADVMPGWPVQLQPAWPSRCTAVVIGDEITILEGQVAPVTQPWVSTIAADGATRSGTPVPGIEMWCGGTWAVGPDGVAYGSMHEVGDSPAAPKSSVLVAVRFDGARAGFPVKIDGIASGPAFDAAGRIVVTVSSFPRPTSRVVAFDQNGTGVSASSAELPLATGVVAYSDGAYECGAPRPRPPLIAQDGTIFVFSEIDISIFALDPLLEVMGGWPYWPATSLVYRFSPREELGCGSLALPAVGPDSTLYLPLQARDASVGGTIVAIGPDGRVRPGWPVELRRPGAAFWSVVVGSDGTVYALAIEPESDNSSSASILAIAPDSTVRWTTTIIEP